MARSAEVGVTLPAGETASSLLHRVLTEAAARFPDALSAAALPADAPAFRAGYAEALIRFEAARVAAKERVAIARCILERTQASLMFADVTHVEPLGEKLARPGAQAELVHTRFGDTPALRAEVPFEGTPLRDQAIVDFARRLREQHQISVAAVEALRWIVDHFAQSGGCLDLRGQRFALLGAGAELAPTSSLLRGGAEVLWIDVTDPTAALAAHAPVAGELSVAPGANDVLRAPERIAAAITRFAERGPVHIGMFAYAAGAGREWRLGAAMNAIVGSLSPGTIRSIACFVSPTTVAQVQPEDIRGAELRRERRPAWQRGLEGLGLLPSPGIVQLSGVAIARAIVSLQGVSYQAAQYVSKIAAAETHAVYGPRLDTKDPSPVTVSANVAAITRTRSLSHPIFRAAFVGAPAFGVRTFAPETTRALNGLLMLHDLLNPRAHGAVANSTREPRERARALLSQQVHGGLFSMPHQLEPAIRAAAVLGALRRPDVLWSRAR